MSLIHIKRDHHLTRDAARARVEDMARKLEDEFKLEHRWDDNVLRFKRSGANGAIGVGEDSLEIKIKLGLVLAPMKKKIEQAIRKSLDEFDAAG